MLALNCRSRSMKNKTSHQPAKFTVARLLLAGALVDFDATRRWERQHAAPSAEGDASAPQAPAIDPELLKEEADRAALTPEVAKDLRLPEQDSVLILDTFRGTPEPLPPPRSDGDLNRNTGHNSLRAAI